MRRFGLLVVAVVLMGADQPKSKEVAAEEKRFEGTWRFASLEIEGKALPKDAFSKAKLVLKGDTHTYSNPSSTSHGTFVVNPDVKPKTLDVTFSDGPEKGNTLHGIYELEADTYRLCISLGGKPRPMAFVSEPGSGHVLEVLKRETR